MKRGFKSLIQTTMVIQIGEGLMVISFCMTSLQLGMKLSGDRVRHLAV
jgi:hypothetical protein